MRKIIAPTRSTYMTVKDKAENFTTATIIALYPFIICGTFDYTCIVTAFNSAIIQGMITCITTALPTCGGSTFYRHFVCTFPSPLKEKQN